MFNFFGEKVLIDTQIIIFLNNLGEYHKLTKKDREYLSKCRLYVSIASYWEMAVKIRLNKLDIQQPLEKFIKKQINNNIEILDIDTEILSLVESLQIKPEHRDPFDHLIICTGLYHDIAVFSSDTDFPFYFSKK